MSVRLLLIVFIICKSGYGLADPHTYPVLMITWRGETEAELGFKNTLLELGVTADIETFDANRDINRLAEYLRNNREKIREKRLIYTFGTSATKTVHNFSFLDVPHVFNIVSDPVSAGVATTLDRPNRGITGAKLSLDPQLVLELFEPILPFHKIGVLFDPREGNSVSQLISVSNAASQRGKTVTALRFSPDGDEMTKQISMLRSKLSKVDIIYVTNSSSYVAHKGSLGDVIPENKVSIGASSAYVGSSVSIIFGTHYRERGDATAYIAAKILLEKIAPEKIPINEVTASDAIIFVKKDHSETAQLNFGAAANKVVYQ